MKPLAELTLDDLLSEFSQMEDQWEYMDFLLKLGGEFPEIPPEEKVEANRVHGCQNQVWLSVRTEVVPGQPPRLRFHAGSDGMISRGMVAVVMRMYDGKTPREILEFDFKTMIKKLGLDRQLGLNRRNGLSGMVQRIRQTAAEALVANDQ